MAAAGTMSEAWIGPSQSDSAVGGALSESERVGEGRDRRLSVRLLLLLLRELSGGATEQNARM